MNDLGEMVISLTQEIVRLENIIKELKTKRYDLELEIFVGDADGHIEMHEEVTVREIEKLIGDVEKERLRNGGEYPYVERAYVRVKDAYYEFVIENDKLIISEYPSSFHNRFCYH